MVKTKQTKKIKELEDQKSPDGIEEEREVHTQYSRGYGKSYVGTFLLLFGLYFLLQNFGLIDINLGKLWPIFLIIPGIFMLIK